MFLQVRLRKSCSWILFLVSVCMCLLSLCSLLDLSAAPHKHTHTVLNETTYFMLYIFIQVGAQMLALARTHRNQTVVSGIVWSTVTRIFTDRTQEDKDKHNWNVWTVKEKCQHDGKRYNKIHQMTKSVQHNWGSPNPGNEVKGEVSVAINGR